MSFSSISVHPPRYFLLTPSVHVLTEKPGRVVAYEPSDRGLSGLACTAVATIPLNGSEASEAATCTKTYIKNIKVSGLVKYSKD